MKFGKYFLYGFIINIIILLISLATNVNLVYMLALLIWTNMMLYAYKDLERRSMLFAFGIAFFVFLMGRDFLQQVFNYKVENYSQEIQNHAFLSILISLIAIWIGYYIFSKSKRYRNIVSELSTEKTYLHYVKKLSLYIYYVSWVFALISKLLVIRFVSSNSYFEYYTEYSSVLNGNIVFYAISKIEVLMPIALCIFMATLPTKKQIKVPIILYGLYMLVSLGSGQRSTLILGLLWIFVYLVFRQGLNSQEKWFSKKLLVLGILFVPILAIFGSILSVLREGGNIQNINYFYSLFDFFYDQGVTINAVKNAYIYESAIQPGYLYTFEFLRSGILARLFGIEVYHGNTIDHALYGGSFTHALGFAVLGNLYLAGRGTGSSYIAELFFDYGYIGVFLGSVFYSYILLNITRIAKKSPLVLAICFAMITQILWAPRGSFSGMITVLFYPTTIATFLFIFGLSKLLAYRKNKNNHYR